MTDSYKIDTEFSADSIIQKSGFHDGKSFREDMVTNIIELKHAHVEMALSKAGYLSPLRAKALRSEVEELRSALEQFYDCFQQGYDCTFDSVMSDALSKAYEVLAKREGSE